MTRTVALLVVFGAIAGIEAHHGSADYDVNREVSVEGTVAEWRWSSPHTWVFLTAAGSNGPAEWSGEGPPLQWAEARGWSKATLKPGDRVRLVNNPSRRETHSGLVKLIEHTGGNLIRQPALARRTLNGARRPGLVSVACALHDSGSWQLCDSTFRTAVARAALSSSSTAGHCQLSHGRRRCRRSRRPATASLPMTAAALDSPTNPRTGSTTTLLPTISAELIDDKKLRDVSLVGFSMGGGEVARYIANYGETNLHSVVFAAAVPPYLMKSEENPHGPLTAEKAMELETALRADCDAFFDGFTKDFFSANGKLMVTETDRQEALALCKQSDQAAALGCMQAWATTDFRADLPRITVPTLVLHGDADATVPFEGSGARTHKMVKGSTLQVIPGAPHGMNVSHATEFNAGLTAFLNGVRETAVRN